MRFFNDPQFRARFAQMLGDMHVDSLRTDSEGNAERLDAGEVAYVLKALEYVYAETADVEYPELKAKMLIPVDTSVPNGAETYTYYQWDKVGSAKFITNYAKDFPSADAFLKRFNAPIAAIGNSYGYTMQDIRAAQSVQYGLGAPLDLVRGDAAHLAHEMFVDDVAAYGNAARGLKGFVNHADIPDVTVSAGGGAWTTALAAVNDTNNAIILADLDKLANSPEQTTFGMQKPDTLILPLSVKPRVTAKSSLYDNRTLIATWLERQDAIKNVEYWAKLDAANSNGNLTAGVARAMVYKRNPRVVRLVIPQLFEQFPPQQRGLRFKVLCHSRIGGVSLRYPKACARMNVGT